MHDQRILLCMTGSISLNMTNTITTCKVFSDISQDLLTTTSQLPWPLVSRFDDGVLFSEIYTGKVTRNVQQQTFWTRYKNTKHNKFYLYNKKKLSPAIPPFPPPRLLNSPCLSERAGTAGLTLRWLQPWDSRQVPHSHINFELLESNTSQHMSNTTAC